MQEGWKQTNKKTIPKQAKKQKEITTTELAEGGNTISTQVPWHPNRSLHVGVGKNIKIIRVLLTPSEPADMFFAHRVEFAHYKEDY